MKQPRFTRTLHFRLSAMFLLLLAIAASGYYIWIQATVLRYEQAPGEDEFYARLAKTQLDSLAGLLTPQLDDLAAVEAVLVDYGRRVARYDAELTLINSLGSVLTSTSPDSLSQVLVQVDPDLLDSMSSPGWDFSSYPNQYNIDAYENRIFEVSKLPRTGSGEAPGGFLVASFTPVIYQPGEIEQDNRRMIFQAVFIILLAAAASGLIIMTWISRRIQALSDGVAAFREGDLERRVPMGSSDEIGSLGRNFNSMASRLAALIDRLRQSDLFHRQLIANISHDLRTPMASLRGYVETLLLKGDTLTVTERNRYLGIINSNLEHLDRLLNHLLQLSQLDSGQANFKLEGFSLEELTMEVLGRCEGLSAERRISLQSNIEGNLPPVYADPLQIGMALQNLVENGIKFTEPEGRVTVNLFSRNWSIVVEVEDTGCGIAPEDLPHIFERFFIADKSRSQKGQSSGLGLSITKKIIAGHERDLEVESQLDRGTTFRFSLPLASDS
ncbi:MAG: HAMP domain-containing sensor histidine kinase [bacterium]